MANGVRSYGVLCLVLTLARCASGESHADMTAFERWSAHGERIRQLPQLDRDQLLGSLYSAQKEADELSFKMELLKTGRDAARSAGNGEAAMTRKLEESQTRLDRTKEYLQGLQKRLLEVAITTTKTESPTNPESPAKSEPPPGGPTPRAILSTPPAPTGSETPGPTDAKAPEPGTAPEAKAPPPAALDFSKGFPSEGSLAGGNLKLQQAYNAKDGSPLMGVYADGDKLTVAWREKDRVLIYNASPLANGGYHLGVVPPNSKYGAAIGYVGADGKFESLR